MVKLGDFPRLVVKLGDERHIFDCAELMYAEVQEIEKVTGSSFAEWERELGRYSITVPATLCLRPGTLGVMTIPRPPKGAGPSGRRVWRAVLGEFELEEHERALVTVLVRQVDRLDELEALIAAEGLMVSGHGTCKMHPAVIEARQSAIAVARIAAALRLPAGEQQDGAEPGQRRAGVRGVYQIHGGAA